MSNLLDHAKRELVAIGYDLGDTEEGPNKWMMESVVELLEVFSNQGHSGASAPYTVDVFCKLALFKPLGPLTGKDEEWVEVGEGVWQNNRAFSVFKGTDGRAYDIDGRVFREPNGVCYTSRDSRVYIEFPYTPRTEYVDVEGVTNE